jgi:hypothetical protein
MWHRLQSVTPAKEESRTKVHATTFVEPLVMLQREFNSGRWAPPESGQAD